MSHLYLTESGLKVGLREGQLVIKDSKREHEHHIPLSNIDGISVFGMAQVSTQLIRECLSRDIAIGYYSDDGHYFGTVCSTGRIDPQRQKRQIYLTDDRSFCLDWARAIVTAKIQNSLALLQSMPEIYEFGYDELKGLLHSLEYLDYADSVDMVLGFEGNAARSYFACLPKLLLNDDFMFKGRSARPPKDPFNSMLSYGYSIFYRNLIGVIERHGLHPYFAFLHKMKFGHAALASDLIEEYRAPLVDRTVLDLVNTGEVSVSDFYVNGSGAVYMNKELLKRISDVFSRIILERRQYFHDSGNRRSYGFQVMIDKKMELLLEAIEKRDASVYRPYVWRLEDAFVSSGEENEHDVGKDARSVTV